jgi:hypothetical protein
VSDCSLIAVATEELWGLLIALWVIAMALWGVTVPLDVTFLKPYLYEALSVHHRQTTLQMA